MKKHIPYGRQWIDEEDIKAVEEVLRSDYLTTGPKITEFEKKLIEITGAKYAVTIANGTAALHAACFAAGISAGDEVITTPITFAASSNAVLYCGGRPVFADINPVTYNIDPDDIKRKITRNTKAIIPVHFTGQPCNMDPILKIAEKYGLIVIEDAAHAIGAKYKGKSVGSISNMTTFSFHPVKQITTGEGGAITTNDERLYEQLSMFRTHGITRNTNKMINNEGPWFYEQQFLGFNYRMTDIQAALGISQLKKLQMFIQKRKEYASIYDEAFKDFEEVITPAQLPETESSWHLYVIQLNLDRLKMGRKEIYQGLLDEGIGVNVHYTPVYYHPYYQNLGYKKGICPKAEALYEKIITLPLYPAMTKEDVEYVIEVVKKVLL
ncbi:MAG: UDP-4-amino-4,6-dideoxy-N-acetyl-beta-L-altrosamine transaminase [Ignavibacteriales bacterium]